MTDTVLTYKGRPIIDLTKNELVDAMTWAFQEIEYQRERADRFLNAAALAEPEPEPPTDEELLQVFDTACLSEGGMVDEIHLRGLRAVLTCWGNHLASPDSSTSTRSENV